MVTSCPACVSSYAATNPDSPAPIIRTLLGDTAGNCLRRKLQLCCGANCADAASKPSFRNSLRSIGMDIASPGGCDVADLRQNCTQIHWEWVVGKRENKPAGRLQDCLFSGCGPGAGGRRRLTSRGNRGNTDQLTRITTHPPARFSNTHRWLPRACLGVESS